MDGGHRVVHHPATARAAGSRSPWALAALSLVISGVIGAAFVILVVGLEALLEGQTQGKTLAVAASTLVAFGLIQPVRRREVERTVAAIRPSVAALWLPRRDAAP